LVGSVWAAPEMVRPFFCRGMSGSRRRGMSALRCARRGMSWPGHRAAGGQESGRSVGRPAELQPASTPASYCRRLELHPCRRRRNPLERGMSAFRRKRARNEHGQTYMHTHSLARSDDHRRADDHRREIVHAVVIISELGSSPPADRAGKRIIGTPVPSHLADHHYVSEYLRLPSRRRLSRPV
jgi:hypothetical protein